MKPSEVLLQHLNDVRALAKTCHVRELRVFGSVARHEDRETSDIDLLAFYAEDATIFDHAAFTCRLKELLGIDCDVLSDEILDKSGFEKMMEISITLDDFEAGRYAVKGAVPREERSSSSTENIRWITERISGTISGMTYEEFLADPIRYDALTYQFQLLSSILNNSDPKQAEAAGRNYGVDFTGYSALHELLLTTTYPRMLYQAARKLAAAQQ